MTRRWAVVVVTLAGAAVVSACSPPDLNVLPAPAAISGSTYHLGADFRDALNLPLGAKVKQSGAVIGEVTTIRTKDFVARVDMDISSSVKLPVGTTAQVRFTTPLGEDYIAIYPPARPSGKYLQADDVLSPTSTSAAPTIEDAFAALSLLLNGGGIDQIATIVHELDRTISGRTGTIRTVLDRMHQLVGGLNSHRGDIDRALSGLHQLAVTLGAGDDVINEALDRFPAALRIVAGQTGKVNDLLTHVSRLAVVTKSVLDRSTNTLLADMDLLKPAVQSLVQVRGTIVPAMQALTTFGRNIEQAAPGDYVNANGAFNLIFNHTALVPHASGNTSASGQDAVRRLLTAGMPATAPGGRRR
ncbi:MAG: MCE family protein [Jatrophihabitans sp.]